MMQIFEMVVIHSVLLGQEGDLERRLPSDLPATTLSLLSLYHLQSLFTYRKELSPPSTLTEIWLGTRPPLLIS